MVYIIQDDGTKNFSSALRHGELRAISTKDYPKHSKEAAIRALTTLDRELSEFDVDKDFLLLTGDPINIGLALYILLQDNPVVNCLKWDKQTQKYLVVPVYGSLYDNN